jgi:putative thioredoxin
MTMNSDFILDVSEADFEEQVLAYSHAAPVLVDFWAEWCVPCKVLGPILEKIAEESQGAFRLAKVNVDQNPNLARQFRINGIPNVKAFRNGAVTAELHGAQPEPKVREFVRGIVPGELDLLLEKGRSLLAQDQLYQAEETFRAVLDQAPGSSGAAFGLSKTLILQGEPTEALQILRRFPAGKEYTQAQNLLPLAEALAGGPPETDTEDSLAAAYERSLRLVLRGNLEAAVDGLMDVLRQDKRYRSGEPRRLILGLLELLGEEHPAVQGYRSELSSILF